MVEIFAELLIVFPATSLAAICFWHWTQLLKVERLTKKNRRQKLQFFLKRVIGYRQDLLPFPTLDCWSPSDAAFFRWIAPKLLPQACLRSCLKRCWNCEHDIFFRRILPQNLSVPRRPGRRKYPSHQRAQLGQAWLVSSGKKCLGDERSRPEVKLGNLEVKLWSWWLFKLWKAPFLKEGFMF